MFMLFLFRISRLFLKKHQYNQQELRRYSMGNKMSIDRNRLYSFLIYPMAAAIFISGCATGPKKVVELGQDKTPVAQQSTATPAPVQLQPTKNAQPASPIAAPPASQMIQSKAAEATAPKDITPSEPRIFFEPSKSNINQVLGIDFTMAENGKSRLVVTTAKKTTYDLDRKDEKTLVLKVHDSTIANPLLMRQIDTTQFPSALAGIKQIHYPDKKEVDLVLTLRDIVPFNVKPTDTGIIMDFGQTSVKVSEKTLVPLELAETETRTLSATTQAQTPVAGAASTAVAVAKSEGKKSKGEPMDLDFVDVDVTQILRLINDVSGENVVWDPTIAGRKVSMILKHVYWDEALDLVLQNNDLAKRYRGNNIIWITTKERMKQILAEEEAEKQRIRQAADDEEKRRIEKLNAAKEEAPLVTEYLPVDFAKANDIKSHITISKRGTMTVDDRTNTIIITDVAESVETAKKTLNQFDTPVKQIMIEARIVNATNAFTRQLGLRWNAGASTGTGTRISSNTTTTEGWGGTFSTNLPDAWDTSTSLIGLSFAKLISGGNGSLALDASLALAEKNGTAQTISAPKVIARNGTKAEIRSGDTLITQPTENVDSKEIHADLSLTVTPNAISDNNYITMTVDVTDDQIVSPSQLLTKSLSTTLMIKSGETVVIGGIIKDNKTNNEAGVPFLKDIPGLGWLFKAKLQDTEKSELLIFLTPTVLSLSAEGF
jgi:type IV pilus assembly protein PilQ